MTDNVTHLPQSAPKSIIGPAFSGHRVVIEGRVIPHLRAIEIGDEVELILDDRFGLRVPKEDAYPIAHIIAQALAIGQGYPSLNAESPGRPFAPEMKIIG